MYEIVQSLDAPVPQMGEQLVNIVQFFAEQLLVVAETVIEVPKILLDRTPQRFGDRLRQPQMAEQLVDVPTVVSYSTLQQLTAEQIVDIPVPGRAGGGGRGDLQGFAGQGSTAFSGAVRVDIPVPRSGGLQDSRPGQGSTASSLALVSQMKLGKGCFALFPGWVRTRGRNWVRTLLHGLRRVMPSPWRSTTTSLRRSRRRRRRWRRAQ